jgi:hypothetical protein
MQVDKLNNQDALAVIQKLAVLDSQEKRIEFFFDFFATNYRPIPPSLKDYVEIDLESRVSYALIDYCSDMIAAINTKEEYIKVSQLIKLIRTTGGTKEVFDAIKYEVASSVENDDQHSSRTFNDHLTAIWDLLNHPQHTLSDFTEQLKASKGYQAMITTSMQGHALLMQSAAASSNEPMSDHEHVMDQPPSVSANPNGHGK